MLICYFLKRVMINSQLHTASQHTRRSFTHETKKKKKKENQLFDMRKFHSLQLLLLLLRFFLYIYFV
jgi:hypothetical protein